MTKKQFNKKFPNGLTNWIETHHEVVCFITSQQLLEDADDKITWVSKGQGTGGIWDLAEQWTDEFENLHKDAQWGEDGGLGEYFEEIEKFCNEKNMTPHEQSN